MTSRDDRDRRLTRKEAATYLGIASATLASYASNGRVKIPYVKIGRSVRYMQSDLDRFLESVRVGGPEPDDPEQ